MSMRDIQVIDDFLPDPKLYREYALTQSFRSFHFEHCSFHGIAPQALDSLVPSILRKYFPLCEPTLSFFRRSPEGQEEPHFIHTDIDMGEWSTILYLNPDPPEMDGTAFWTHKSSGSICSFIAHERSQEGLNTEGWHMRKLVRAKFNRMVMFPSHFFHSRSIPENWGQDSEARLTQVTFGLGVI